MKNLIIIRHAKSSWEFDTKDFERPLLNKGIENAIKVADYSKSSLPDDFIILSSPAKRAFETAKIFVKQWNFDSNKIILVDDLYTFNSNNLEQIVKSCSNNYQNLILFGHNSAITDFVNKFGDIFMDNVPTSGLVSINFEINNWKDIKKGNTNKIIIPKEI